MNGQTTLNRDTRSSFIDVDSDDELYPHSHQPLNSPVARPNAPTPSTMNFEIPPVLDSDSPLYSYPGSSQGTSMHRTGYTHAVMPPSHDLSDSSVSLSSEEHSGSSRWSQDNTYSTTSRSRSGSNAQPSKDTPYEQWGPLDEADETSVSDDYDSEDDMIGDQGMDEDDLEGESTSAIRLAEDGTGRIVQANGIAISQLSVEPGAYIPSIYARFS